MMVNGIEVKTPTTLRTPSFALSAGSQADSSLVDCIEQAVFRAMSSVNRFSQATHQSKEIVLRIDGKALARLILPTIISEGQRQGLDLVVRPPGV